MSCANQAPEEPAPPPAGQPPGKKQKKQKKQGTSTPGRPRFRLWVQGDPAPLDVLLTAMRYHHSIAIWEERQKERNDTAVAEALKQSAEYAKSALPYTNQRTKPAEPEPVRKTVQ